MGYIFNHPTQYHREIFDYDLIIDCILEAIGPARLTEEMKQWCPFPFTDDGVAFKIYKERRFNTIAETSREVTDQELSMILGGMVCKQSDVIGQKGLKS